MFFFIITTLIEEQLKIKKMFLNRDMQPNKFAFLTRVRKIRNKGANSQSLNSNVN